MSESKNYETTIVITPDLDQNDFGVVVNKFNNLMKDNGAEISNQEIWGFRKLAYPIKKKQSGFFIFTEFTAPVQFITKLEREYQYDDRIMRYLTVKLDKHAVAYNIKRRERLQRNSSSSTPLPDNNL